MIAAPLELRAPGEPLRVGPYELLEPIGSGGAATVYLARGTADPGRAVAVKVLHPHLRDEAALVADFVREGRLAARVRHPRVVPVLDVGVTPQGVFLVMEPVLGLSLAALTAAAQRGPGRLPERVAARILCDALEGLHAAHEVTDDGGAPLGLVHRDFTPHNLLVGDDGGTVLADFGIAKPTRVPGHTRTGIVKGKIPYMAPEQLRGQALDRRTDLWAAGVVAWELFTGQALYGDDDEPTIMMKIATTRPPSLASLRPDLPAALLAAVDRALCPERDGRWPDADRMRAALAEGAEPLGGIADRAEVALILSALTGGELARKRIALARAASTAGSAVRRRLPRGWAVIGALTLALASTGALLWLRSAPPPPTLGMEPPRPAPEPAPRPVASEDRPSTVAGQSEPRSRGASSEQRSQDRGLRDRQAISRPRRLGAGRPDGHAPPLADNPYR